MTTVTKIDVLIVGAGPAGLVCANALAKGHVAVKVIDIRLSSSPVPEHRAEPILTLSPKAGQDSRWTSRWIYATHNGSPSGAVLTCLGHCG